ncbi:hypothetical protein SCA6_019261 [Theobroma cacao]
MPSNLLDCVLLLLLFMLILKKLNWRLTMQGYMEWKIILISLLETFCNLFHR